MVWFDPESLFWALVIELLGARFGGWLQRAVGAASARWRRVVNGLRDDSTE